MLIYRFRITCEEHDGFLREIEIRPNQNFLDFHHILIDSSELLHCERASFFMTDKKYKKDREISLKSGKRQVRKYDEDLDQIVTELVALPTMKVSKLKEYIEDPHQKMIYEFEGRDYFSFHIELFKIFPSDGVESFPRCVKRIAELPRKVEQPATIPQAPPLPRVIVTKVPLPKIEELVKFNEIVEDEHELANIESELGMLIAEDEPPSFDVPEPDVARDDDFSFTGEEEEDEDQDDKMDHLDDYEDIETLDKRLSGYDRDSEDY